MMLSSGPLRHLPAALMPWMKHMRGGNPPERVFIIFSLEQQAMKLFTRVSAFLVVVTFGLVAGCAGGPHQESTGEYVTDSWITTKVKAALIEDQQVKATEVNVETFKGTVQLSGFVSSQVAMDQAISLTRGIRGVTAVKNDMRIK